MPYHKSPRIKMGEVKVKASCENTTGTNTTIGKKRGTPKRGKRWGKTWKTRVMEVLI